VAVYTNAEMNLNKPELLQQCQQILESIDRS